MVVDNIERSLKENVNSFIEEVDEMEKIQTASINTRRHLEDSIRQIMIENGDNKEALDIAINAIDILRNVSDEAVAKAYKFLEGSLNSALERMFINTTRRIRLREYTRSGQYPQLDLELVVAGDRKRSLKSDSGHGIAQIVSLLSLLSLIVITGSRRIMVIDEVVSGLSVNNRKIISDILWNFTEIGFQFIVNEHGFIPKGSKVYHLEMVGDVSSVKDTYIDEGGVYLTSKGKIDNSSDLEVLEEEQFDLVDGGNVVSI